MTTVPPRKRQKPEPIVTAEWLDAQVCSNPECTGFTRICTCAPAAIRRRVRGALHQRHRRAAACLPGVRADGRRRRGAGTGAVPIMTGALRRSTMLFGSTTPFSVARRSRNTATDPPSG